MKTKILFTLILTVLIFTFSTQQTFAGSKGLYISGGGGWFSPGNITGNDYTATEEHLIPCQDPLVCENFGTTGYRDFYDTGASLNDGFSIVAAVGFHLSENFRIEGEYAYRKASMNESWGTGTTYFQTEEGCGDWDCETLHAPSSHNEFLKDNAASTASQTFDRDEDIESHSFMVNAFLDLPVGKKFAWYVGAGLGVALVKYDVEQETQVQNMPTVWVDPNSSLDLYELTPTLYKDKVDGNEFAYQFMAGAGYDLTDTLTLTTGYRFFSIVNSFSSHGVEAGIRINF